MTMQPDNGNMGENGIGKFELTPQETNVLSILWLESKGIPTEETWLRSEETLSFQQEMISFFEHGWMRSEVFSYLFPTNSERFMNDRVVTIAEEFNAHLDDSINLDLEPNEREKSLKIDIFARYILRFLSGKDYDTEMMLIPWKVSPDEIRKIFLEYPNPYALRYKERFYALLAKSDQKDAMLEAMEYVMSMLYAGEEKDTVEVLDTALRAIGKINPFYILPLYPDFTNKRAYCFGANYQKA